MRDQPEEGQGPRWSTTSNVTPILLTAIVLTSVVTGAFVVLAVLRRRPKDPTVDRETGEPLFI
ncbi:MAG TPA: hypothetical protein VHN99_08365 [Deinococcales bacterium]|nr:hypothetical protein [Deinococcales bacterium]